MAGVDANFVDFNNPSISPQLNPPKVRSSRSSARGQPVVANPITGEAPQPVVAQPPKQKTVVQPDYSITPSPGYDPQQATGSAPVKSFGPMSGISPILFPPVKFAEYTPYGATSPTLIDPSKVELFANLQGYEPKKNFSRDAILDIVRRPDKVDPELKKIFDEWLVGEEKKAVERKEFAEYSAMFPGRKTVLGAGGTVLG